MDDSIKSVVRNVVDEFVQADRLFTAYDVTKAVRVRAGRSTNVRHNEAKEEVHALLEPQLNAGLYKRELRNFGAGEPAWVYYPDGEDPNTYDPHNTQRSVVRVAQVAQRAAAPQLPPASDDEDEPATQDGRGRVCVPAKFLRDIGLKYGMRAFVVADKEKLVVYKKQPTVPFAASYRVDAHNNLRVGHNVVELANLANKKYRFEKKGDTVEVK